MKMNKDKAKKWAKTISRSRTSVDAKHNAAEEKLIAVLLMHFNGDLEAVRKVLIENTDNLLCILRSIDRDDAAFDAARDFLGTECGNMSKAHIGARKAFNFYMAETPYDSDVLTFLTIVQTKDGEFAIQDPHGNFMQHFTENREAFKRAGLTVKVVSIKEKDELDKYFVKDLVELLQIERG